MNYKKVISCILVGTMCFSMLVGCGASNTGDVNQPEAGAENVVKTETPQLEGYNLLWSDEFDGTELDETIWNYEPHEPGWTNNELQEYTTSTDNVFVRDGKVVLKAIKTEKDGKDYYTSGKITSQNKKDFMYGKVVASAKVPEGKGLWPAIWMMPQDESYYGQWPKCGEIDIMEVLGDDVKKTYATIHYGEPHAEQQGTYVINNILKDGTFASKFHEYSVEWEPGEMRFYIDDMKILTVNDWFTAVPGEDEKEYPAPFNQPFFVQMNLAVGGNWPGDPDENTDFDKAEFEIDYVRVYQKDSYDTNVTKPKKEYRAPDETGNYINNGDFMSELNKKNDWTFYKASGGEGEAVVDNGELIVSTTAEGTEDYSVQMFQAKIPQIKGHKYRVTFDMYADENRKAIVCVSAPTAGWIRYLVDTEFDVTTEKQSYTFEYEMTEKDDNNGRLEFNLGNRGSMATVHISNVRLEDITE
ncbi:MAG: family 16 glycosylhydrolase [Lachnospiraceae bacterium]|nr:family 16 glycosylhydrolase [Candidatus Colinaster scatohippi]